MGRLGYRPAYDGVRALAVIGVMCDHGRVVRVSGGFIGVDVFFVLSGFLITSLLLEEWAFNGSINRLAFYGRRARRLLPALFATLGLVAVLYIARPSLNRGWSFGATALAVLGYAGNWVTAAVRTTTYVPLGLLEHTWSLAIEEQFYIVWPLILVVCLRRNWSPGRLFALLVALAAASAAWRAAAFHGVFGLNVHSAFLRTDMRADGLALGCALAVAAATVTGRALLRRLAGPMPVALAAGGFILLVALTAKSVSDKRLYFGEFAAVNLAAAILIAHVLVADRSLLTRGLKNRMLVWVGRRSYGVYLYHLPIFAAISALSLPFHFVGNFALMVALSMLAAAASYAWIESYFLRGKRYPSKQQTREPVELAPQPAPAPSAALAALSPMSPVELTADFEQYVGVVDKSSIPHSRETLPKAWLGGYDRKATEQLLSRLDATCQNLVSGRQELEKRVEEFETMFAGHRQSEQGLSDDVAQLRAELEGMRQREHTLAEQLQRSEQTFNDDRSNLKSELDGARERESALVEQLRGTESLAEDVSNLRLELDGARERENALREQLRSAERDLAGHERLERVLSELRESAKRSADEIRAASRAEAEKTLKKAKEREAEIVRNAEREFARLDGERQRLEALADKLRKELSGVLVSTLDRLKPNLERVEPDGSADDSPQNGKRSTSRAKGAVPTATTSARALRERRQRK